MNTIVVAALAIVAGAFAAASDAAPTGTSGWDAVLKFVLAASFVAAVSKAPRWVAIVCATVAAVFSGSAGLFAVAALAQLLAIAPVAFQRRNRILSALAAALAIQVLLRLQEIWFFGLPSIVAGAAIVLGLVFGYGYSSPRVRTRTRWAVLAVGGLAVLVALIGGIGLLSARTDVELGVQAARRGLSAAREADTAAIVAELGEAERALVSAQSHVDWAPARLLRLLPIAAQHHRAISVATDEGVAVVRVATATLRDADIESIRLTAGAVDVAALQGMAPQLASTAARLEGAAERIDQGLSPWLVPPVADRIEELQQELADVAPEARLAAEGAAVVPRMLGSEGPRQYFVMFGTPAESRELGGFLGSWALLRFENGVMSKVADGRTGELKTLARGRTLDISQYPQWYFDSAQVLDWPQNLTGTPDFSVVAKAARELLGGPDGLQMDGVIYLDTWAVIDMLELTGPIKVGFRDEMITAENAEAFFFDEQYRLDGNRTETFDELAEAIDRILAAIGSDDLPGPERLGKVLGPAARAGRLQVVTFDAAENDFLRKIRLLRDFEPPAGDGFAIVQTDGASNKLDIYLQRDITYDVAVAGDGSLVATVTVELRLDVPADAPQYALGFKEDGQGLLLLSLYTPHALTAVRLDGVPVEFASTVEYGYSRYLVTVATPVKGVRTVEYEVTGRVDPATSYALGIWHQPLVNNDQVHVRYSGPDGARTADYEQVENVVFTADAGSG